MRKHFCLALTLLISASLSFPQEVIENPEKPLSSNAGRALKLKEEYRITDESAEFFFQSPRYLKVAPDGTIFIYDQELLLRLDREGKFLHNFYKKGQGPGELNYVRNYTFFDNNIIIHSVNPNKIVWFDFNGELVKNFKIHIPGSFSFQLFYKNNYYFFKSNFPNIGGKPTLVDIPQTLVAMTQDGNEIKDIISFPIKVYVLGGALVMVSSLKSVPYKNKFLFISHTQEYLVKLYDIESQKLLCSFKRAYKRIKTPKDYRGGAIIMGGKRYEPARQKYMSDINNLFIYKDFLWVLTSTKDKEKGYLIDVFNFDGKFIDSFYLNLNGNLISTHEDSIFVRETDEDGMISIVKYKALNELDCLIGL